MMQHANKFVGADIDELNNAASWQQILKLAQVYTTTDRRRSQRVRRKLSKIVDLPDNENRLHAPSCFTKRAKKPSSTTPTMGTAVDTNEKISLTRSKQVSFSLGPIYFSNEARNAGLFYVENTSADPYADQAVVVKTDRETVNTQDQYAKCIAVPAQNAIFSSGSKKLPQNAQTTNAASRVMCSLARFKRNRAFNLREGYTKVSQEPLIDSNDK